MTTHTMLAFDRRQQIGHTDPLLAFALRAAAIGERRADCDVCDASLLATIAREAREAVQKSGGDFDALTAENGFL